MIICDKYGYPIETFINHPFRNAFRWFGLFITGQLRIKHSTTPVNKAEAILKAIRETDVGSDVVIHNEDMSVWCILTKKCEEHPERKQ